MKFDRWTKPEGTTWAYWQFNEYETHLNDMYRTGEALSNFSMYHIRRSEGGSNPAEVLCATGPNAHRFPRDKDSFSRSSKDLHTWIRASFVMAATGALENYISRAVQTALISDPAAYYGKPKAIDGLNWLKLGIKADHSEYLKSVTSNIWDSRYSNLKKVFGEIQDVHKEISELDKIRIYRNGVGHAFGRNISTDINFLTRNVDGLNGISEQRFISWLSLISSTAKSIDKHLTRNHIGEFELLMHFHNHIKTYKDTPPRKKAFINNYKATLTRDIGHSRGANYLQEMMNYYDSI